MHFLFLILSFFHETKETIRLLKSQFEDKGKKISEFVNSDKKSDKKTVIKVFQLMEEMIE